MIEILPEFKRGYITFGFNKKYLCIYWKPYYPYVVYADRVEKSKRMGWFKYKL